MLGQSGTTGDYGFHRGAIHPDSPQHDLQHGLADYGDHGDSFPDGRV